jgi:hypothetical protein
LAKALKATNPKGFSVPWVWIRREIARRWGVPPYVVDHDIPHQEVEIELRLMRVEAEVAEFQRRRKR